LGFLIEFLDAKRHFVHQSRNKKNGGQNNHVHVSGVAERPLNGTAEPRIIESRPIESNTLDDRVIDLFSLSEHDQLQPLIDELQPLIDELQPFMDELQQPMDELQPLIDELQPLIDDLQSLVGVLQPLLMSCTGASVRRRPTNAKWE
jgi:hypothetical protein